MSAFSLPLNALANSQGGEMDAIAWLACPEVQAFLVETVWKILINSLGAEREGAETKKWVSRKVSHVATVSRDLICDRYHRIRLDQSQALAAAENNLKRAKSHTSGSIAWLRSGQGAEVGRPLGVPKAKPGMPATGGAEPATGGDMKRHVDDHRDQPA